MMDMINAAIPLSGEQTPMPRDEFLTLLGFDPALPNEELPLNDLFHQCFYLMDNPAWRSLPEDKRADALQMDNVVMSNMGRPGL